MSEIADEITEEIIESLGEKLGLYSEIHMDWELLVSSSEVAEKCFDYYVHSQDLTEEEKPYLLEIILESVGDYIADGSSFPKMNEFITLLKKEYDINSDNRDLIIGSCLYDRSVEDILPMTFILRKIVKEKEKSFIKRGFEKVKDKSSFLKFIKFVEKEYVISLNIGFEGAIEEERFKDFFIEMDLWDNDIEKYYIELKQEMLSYPNHKT